MAWAFRYGKLGLFTAVILVCCSSGPISYSVSQIRIDDAQRVLPIGSRSISAPNLRSYYWFFHAGTGLTTVDHFENVPGIPQPQRLLYLETNRDQRLDRTVKTDEILRGEYGAVYMERTCFFNRPVASSPNYISTSLGSTTNQSGYETPALQTGVPREDVSSLTSLSVIRVFHVEQDYAVVTASYESSGELGSLNIGRTKGGEIVPGTNATFLRLKSDDPRLQTYGIPLLLNVNEYVRSNRLRLPSVLLAEELTAVNQYYGFGKLIRQDQFRNGARVLTRSLKPSITEEEQILNSECDARFLQQRSMGLSTVQ